eukprot:TRINITY_DN2459_c1_g1_i4.p1 TRINITY_DN2459_c1_g1~~TRINITY_DN2459_c1_g1_i4.p1  ORF type:complete len:466 (+),score=82.71 TRINITY_DN2459_c1_g1_i4:149-1546(+)
MNAAKDRLDSVWADLLARAQAAPPQAVSADPAEPPAAAAQPLAGRKRRAAPAKRQAAAPRSPAAAAAAPPPVEAAGSPGKAAASATPAARPAAAAGRKRRRAAAAAPASAAPAAPPAAGSAAPPAAAPAADAAHAAAGVGTPAPRRKRPRKVGGGAPARGHGRVAIAFASSVLDNQKTAELRTYLVGMIARAAAVLRVSEIIVFSDTEGAPAEPPAADLFGPAADWDSPTAFTARLLLYSECPQYLRRQLFPLHRDTRHAGLLPPLGLPSHPTAAESPPLRDAVVLPRSSGGLPLADAGLSGGRLVRVESTPPPAEGSRVTLQFPPEAYSAPRPRAQVAPTGAAAEKGLYWGYNVRTASSLSAALCPPGGPPYDLVLGTSERGEDASQPGFALPAACRPLVVFGGPQGLERAATADPALRGLAPDAQGQIFDRWLNVLPDQGSRTIRTEEAVLIALTVLRRSLQW